MTQHHAGTRYTGRLFLIDGLDGSGKSTLIDGLARAWQPGRRVVTTRAIGGDAWGGKLREALLHTPDVGRLPQALALLSAWVSLTEELIVPALLDGVDVLCDRSPLSLHIYQDVTPRVVGDTLKALGRDMLPADCLMCLNVRPERCRARLGVASDVFERVGEAEWRRRYDRLMAHQSAYREAVDGVPPEQLKFAKTLVWLPDAPAEEVLARAIRQVQQTAIYLPSTAAPGL